MAGNGILLGFACRKSLSSILEISNDGFEQWIPVFYDNGCIEPLTSMNHNETIIPVSPSLCHCSSMRFSAACLISNECLKRAKASLYVTFLTSIIPLYLITQQVALHCNATSHSHGEKRPFCVTLEILNYLINILIRDIRYFFLIIDGYQVHTCVRCINNNIECNNPKSATFTSAFTLYTKSDFAFSTSKGNTYIRVLHQFMLQSINIIGERVITLGQTLSLSKELFSIIESYHKLSSFCSKVFNQCVKRGKTFACETPFLRLAKTFSNSLVDKCLLCLYICRGCAQAFDSHTFDSSQYLFQTGKKACIFNVQYYLCHDFNCLFRVAKIHIFSETTSFYPNNCLWTTIKS